eukprot:930405-Amorphochlora_amoeboformis.AAC.1
MRATRRLLASRASSAQMPPPPLSIPSFSVAGRSFVITGGTQGLGLEIGCQLARAGASNIVLVSRGGSWRGERRREKEKGGDKVGRERGEEEERMR